MTHRIVYQSPGEQVSVFCPSASATKDYSIAEVGSRVVPTGVPFWIVEASAIPTDRTFRDAWQLDVVSMGDPSGFGGVA